MLYLAFAAFACCKDQMISETSPVPAKKQVAQLDLDAARAAAEEQRATLTAKFGRQVRCFAKRAFTSPC
jgi:hypothetical protein